MHNTGDNSGYLTLAAALVLALGLLVAAGCSFDSRDCTQGHTCAEGHSCNIALGICEQDSSAPDASDTSQAADGGQTSDTRPTGDASSSRDTATPGQDTSTADSGSSHTYPDDAACLVDPFVSNCVDDSHEYNSEWLDATPLSSENLGCTGPGYSDSIEPFSKQLDATLCSTDSSDWYSVVVAPCEHRSFILDIYVEPRIECPLSLYELVVRKSGKTFGRCTDPAPASGTSFNCEQLAGGGAKVSVLVGSQDTQSLESYYMAVLPWHPSSDERVEFDYDLRVEIRQ